MKPWHWQLIAATVLTVLGVLGKDYIELRERQAVIEQAYTGLTGTVKLWTDETRSTDDRMDEHLSNETR